MNPLNGYTPGAMGRISFGTPSEGARMSEIELPEPTSEHYRWVGDPPRREYYYTAEQVRQAVLAERGRLLPMLAHAVKEADGWHDESRGGQITGDPIMDAAREAIRR